MYFYAKTQFFETLNQLVSIDQIDRRSAVSRRLFDSFPCERSRRNEQPFIGTPLHSATKVPYLAGRDCALVSFALKENMEAQKAIDACNTYTIDTAIAGSAGNFNLYKT